MVRQSLVESIEALKSEDYMVASGFTTDIYLDPIAERVYTFTSSNSTPADAYHKIDRLILSVNNRAIPESVYAAVEAIAEDLEELLGYWQGTEWDGSNHKGVWDEEATSEWEERMFSQGPLEVGYYWEPGDWFVDWKAIKQKWSEGMTAEAIVDSEYLGDTSADGGVDRNEAIEWVEEQIEEWEQEKAEEKAAQ